MENTATANQMSRKVESKKYFFDLKSQSKQKLAVYLYLIFTFFSISFLGFFAIGPTLSTISNLKKQYEDNKRIEKSLSEKIIALSQLNNEYQQISSSLDALYAGIPFSAKTPYITYQLEKIVEKNNYTLKSLGIGKSDLYPVMRKNEGSYSFNFDILLEGNETNVSQFLNDIISFDRISNLSKVSIFNAEQNITKISVTGEAYYNKK